MFSVLIKYHDEREVLDAADDIAWEAGTLHIGDREYLLARGDVAFVMNDSGATVRKYSGK